MRSKADEKDPVKDSWSLSELGRLLGAQEVKGDPEFRVRGLGPLESATPEQVSFLTDSRYAGLIENCKAGALIVSDAFRQLEFNLIITEKPYLALAKAAKLFAAPASEEFTIHPTAVIDKTVQFDGPADVGAHVVIGADCRIGNRSRIGAGSYLGRGVEIGAECLIHARVCVLDHCVLGDRVIVHPGAVIGADGFGFAQDDSGKHHKIPQMGIVQIDDDVEIGANATIDRATFGKTRVKQGTKIDNLVMLAHNVVIGEHCILVGQVGISGSTKVGDYVMFGGQAGIAGHLEIGDRARIGAKSGIMRSIEPDQVIVGSPGAPREEYFRTLINVQRLPRLKEELKRLGNRVQKMEEVLKSNARHR